MSWVEAADYAGAEADPLAGEPALGIIEHMNADHADSLVLMARVLGGRADTTEAVMTAVDRYGFDVVAGGPGGRAALRLGFDAPVATAGGGAAGDDPVGGAGPRRGLKSRTGPEPKKEGRLIGGPPSVDFCEIALEHFSLRA